MDLYTPQDLLLSIIPCYLEYFLQALSYSYRIPAFEPHRDPLDGVTDSLLIPVFALASARWLLTALQYVWLQPGVASKILAAVDLGVEQVFVFALTWFALHLVAAAANRAFGWHQVRRVLQNLVRL